MVFSQVNEKSGKMKDAISLDKKQLTMLMTNLLIVKMIFAFPRFLFKTSGNAAWIEAILLTAITYLLLEISMLFYTKTGNKSILQLAEATGKMPLKIVVALIAVVVIVANLGTEMRTFAESVKLVLLPKTSIEYIMLLFAITIAVGGICGFGALVTINALFLPFCLFFIAILLVSLFSNYEINNLLPILGTGFPEILKRGLSDLSCFGDLIALNLLLPYAEDIETVKKSGRRSVITAGVVLTSLCLAYGMAYPYPFSSEYLLTTYQLSRMVRAGEYFQRFEALFEFVWAITQLLYSAVYVYIICDTLCNAFKLKYVKPLIPCVTIVMVILSFEPSSVVELLQMSERVKAYLFPAAFLLPIIIPGIYLLTGRGRRHE